MEFERDEAEANRLKHGFDFTFAIRIFNGPVRQWADLRPRDEARVVAVGQVYTRRSGCYRIISARPARRDERD